MPVTCFVCRRTQLGIHMIFILLNLRNKSFSSYLLYIESYRYVECRILKLFLPIRAEIPSWECKQTSRRKMAEVHLYFYLECCTRIQLIRGSIEPPAVLRPCSAESVRLRSLILVTSQRMQRSDWLSVMSRARLNDGPYKRPNRPVILRIVTQATACCRSNTWTT